MNKQQGHMLTALASTRCFLGDHAAALATVVSPAVQQRLDDAIAELASTATAQDLYTRDREGSFAVQEASRVALLRDHMTPIARIARLELSEMPELVKLSGSTARLSIQQLAAHADGMAEAARPHAQVFVDAGRQPDFIERLNGAADRMRAAAAAAAQSRVRIKGATSGFAQQLSHSRRLVHALDAFVKEAAGNDTAMIDSWNVAKHVVRTSGTSRTSTTVSSTLATATALAVTAVAALSDRTLEVATVSMPIVLELRPLGVLDRAAPERTLELEESRFEPTTGAPPMKPFTRSRCYNRNPTRNDLAGPRRHRYPEHRQPGDHRATVMQAAILRRIG